MFAMGDKLDLTGDIAEAINTAVTRGHPVVLAGPFTIERDA
jgi:hypothetical protein